MKLSALVVSALTVMLASVAYAAEPRPWLCRDKPVFSSPHAMSYRVTAKSGSAWRMFLMQFSPGAGHDGFDIAKTISGTSSGPLPAGRYFAVALRNLNGNWVCPVDAREERSAGAVANLCFAAHDDGCDVNFVVTSDASSAQEPAHSAGHCCMH